MPTLYYTIGIPGSGKSRFASTIPPDQVVTVSRDRVREQFGDYSREKEACVRAIVVETAKAHLLDGRNVLVDETCIRRDRQEELVRLAVSVGAMPVALYFKVKAAEALARNEVRGRPVPGQFILDSSRNIVLQPPPNMVGPSWAAFMVPQDQSAVWPLKPEWEVKI